MTIFLNKNRHITAVSGSVVYEYALNWKDALELVEVWARGQMEFATREQRIAANTIERLITASPRVANRRELEAKDSPVMRIFNGNVNPSGRASVRWHLAR